MLHFGLLYVVTFRVYIKFCVNFTFDVVTNLSFASDGELTAASCTQTFSLFFSTNLTSTESGLFSHFPTPTNYLEVDKFPTRL